MTRLVDLSTLPWEMSGWYPNTWLFDRSMETGVAPTPDIPWMPVTIPGSVQKHLRANGFIPDWMLGDNARQCEWVENRHWIFRTEIPAGFLAAHTRYEFICGQLDSSASIRWDGEIVAEFTGAHREHRCMLPDADLEKSHQLQVIFHCPDRYLGQVGFTSQMGVLRSRFNYGWDWIARVPQIGLIQSLYIRNTMRAEGRIESLWTELSGEDGILHLCLQAESLSRFEKLFASLYLNENCLLHFPVTPSEMTTQTVTQVQKWFPNAMGEQIGYTLRLETYDQGTLQETLWSRRIGFKSITWRACDGAPEHADPWICVVNGESLFLQGVNWTPIRANYADVEFEEYRKRLLVYRDMGVNLVRVWGGASIEQECFYELCDEYGLMVWQEFPLSSSGPENIPPADADSITEMEKIGRYYLQHLSSHVSLLAWSGGNELQRDASANAGTGTPCTLAEPMLNLLAEQVKKYDPTRRFMPCSSSGPSFMADEQKYGQGLHWDVHGPWGMTSDWSQWMNYWDRDDSLMRSEVGVPAPPTLMTLQKYAGSFSLFPVSRKNKFWVYPTDWWYPVDKGNPPQDIDELNEFIGRKQEQQARGMAYAANATKARFPAVGGFIVWMGHDSFPCPANNSLLDVDGIPKKVYYSLKEIFCRR